jgi:hypothetical protein
VAAACFLFDEDQCMRAGDAVNSLDNPRAGPRGQRRKIMTSAPAVVEQRLASADDVKRILGDLDSTKVLHIMAFRPTVLDVEQASMWLAGDSDVFGPGQPLPPVAGEIVAILTADEEDDRTATR